MILLDTNVISEMLRPAPNAAVVSYLQGLAPEAIFTAAICEAELAYGLALMPVGRKRDALATRVAAFFAASLQGQILPFDSLCAARYGAIRAGREAIGRPSPSRMR